MAMLFEIFARVKTCRKFDTGDLFCKGESCEDGLEVADG